MNNLAITVAFAIALMLVLSPWLAFILRSEKQICFENTALIVLGSNQIRSRLADIRQQLESKLTNAKVASPADRADAAGGLNFFQIPGSLSPIQFLTEAETVIFLALEEANGYVMTAVPMQANGLTVSETKYLLIRSVEALRQVSKARLVLGKLEQDLNMADEEAPVSFW